MSFIVDNSVFIAWFKPREHSPELLALLELARRTEIIVPAIWPYEFSNVIGTAIRKKEISADHAKTIFETLSTFDIVVSSGLDITKISEACAEMQRHGLTSYDLSYLQLAIATKLPIATLDQELVSACRAVGVRLMLL